MGDFRGYIGMVQQDTRDWREIPDVVFHVLFLAAANLGNLVIHRLGVSRDSPPFRPRDGQVVGLNKKFFIFFLIF